MLARMGEVLGLEPRPCVSQTIAELKELHLARAALIKDRTAAKNRAKAITLALLEKQNKKAPRGDRRQTRGDRRRDRKAHPR
jgi:transposase